MAGIAGLGLLFLVGGCGGTVSAAASTQAPAEATGSTAAAAAHPYGSPTQMLDKVRHFGWLHGCSKKPTYNIYGALFIVCNGRSEETVYLDTFAAQSIGQSIERYRADAAARYHVGPGWLVSAYNQQSLSQLVSALR
jgi:hypothetical protein